MDNRSNLDRMLASNGSRLASVSSSAFSLSRCRLLGLLLPELSLGDGFKLLQPKKSKLVVSSFNSQFKRKTNSTIVHCLNTAFPSSNDSVRCTRIIQMICKLDCNRITIHWPNNGNKSADSHRFKWAKSLAIHSTHQPSSAMQIFSAGEYSWAH